MSMAAVSLIVVLLICMLIGIPIAWSLVISSLSAVLIDGNIPIAILSQRLFTSTDQFSMLAIPAFIAAGEIMGKGGISKRLVDFADSIVGSISGGIALVSIVACTFFAAISGSAVATTAAVGGIMYPEMTKRGYPEDYSAAIQAIAGTLGPVIPPSIVFIFYGSATGTSIASLLMSGVIPGLLSCFGLCFIAYVIAKIKRFPKGTPFSVKNIVKSTGSAFTALLMPVIILGGIYSGIFTPTESAVIAVIYGVVVSLFITKEIKIKDFPAIFKSVAISSANLLILVTAANLFGWLVGRFNIPTIVASAIMGISNNKYIFLLLVIAILLVAGMFMEAIAVVVILAPILHPLALTFGIDPVHFGMVVVFMLCLGIATPPFGPTLFVSCGISKQPVVKVSKQLMPFIGIQIILGFIFAFVPFLSTWLPGLMK